MGKQDRVLSRSGQGAREALLVDAANIAWDIADGGHAAVLLEGDRELDNPTNMKAGGLYVLRVVQDATGTRLLTYGTAYKFIGGTDVVLTTTADAIDVLVFYCDGVNMNCIVAALAMAD